MHLKEHRFKEAAWGTMTWIVDDALVPGAGLSLARMTVRPGFTTEAHHHPNCTETIHVIAGALDWIIGAQRIHLTAGETAFVPAATPHFATNMGHEDATMLIAYSAGQRVYEAVTEPM